MLVKCETKSNRVKGLSFHPKLSWILASLHNGHIQLWDYRICSLMETFEEHEGGPVRGVSFHLSQPLFVSGGDDYKVKVWNYKQKRCIFTLLGHLDYIRTVQFHRDYPWILSASDDQTVRIWNWQSRSCIAVLTGHNHYVMCAQFHPKEDLVVSASLDQTVRVWDTSALRDKTVNTSNPSQTRNVTAPDVFGTNDAVVKHVLEGHDRGVNWASFHPTMPLIISGADDRLLKIWRMSESKAWEVDTLKGHFNNVSSCCFLPKKDLIVSNSEDRTIRVWDANKRTAIHTFRRENDRFWILAAHPTNNLLAVGHDSGMVVFKLDRERPLFAMQGKTLYSVQDRSLVRQDVTANTAENQVVVQLRRAPNAMISGFKTMQINPLSPTEPNILVHYGTDGGSYDIIVNGQVEPGDGMGVAFTNRTKFAVLFQSGSIGIYNMRNELSKKFDPPISGTVENIFFGGDNRLLLKSEEKVYLYCFRERKIIEETSVSGGVRYCVWSPNLNHCALFSKYHMTITGKNLDFQHALYENIRLKSGAWDENGVFIYATLSHLKYCIPNGDRGIIRSLAQPIYIIQISQGIMYYMDRDQKLQKEKLNCTEFLFKLALYQQKFNDVNYWIKNGRLCGNVVIGYLKKKGFPEVALHFVDNHQTRFNLALEYGNIEEAMASAFVLDDQNFWSRLGVEALRQGNQQIVEMVYQRTKNFDALSFLYLITGDLNKLEKMVMIADKLNDVPRRFNNALMLGLVEERVKILAEMGQVPLAALTAKAHGLDEYVELLQDSMPAGIERMTESAKLCLPPKPFHSCKEDANWPLAKDIKTIFQAPNLDKVTKPPTIKEAIEAPLVDEHIMDDADAEFLELDDDLDLDLGDLPDLPEPGAAAEKKGDVFQSLAKGDSTPRKWLKTRKLPADLVYAGEFADALGLLKRRIGLKNAAPLKPIFELMFLATHASVPGGPQIPARLTHLSEEGSQEDNLRPRNLFNAARFVELLKDANRLVTTGKFKEALSSFQSILQSLPVAVVESAEDEKQLQECLEIAKDYTLAMRVEATRKTALGERKLEELPAEELKRNLELASFFTVCNLSPNHLILTLRQAMPTSFKAGNFLSATTFARRLIGTNVGQLQGGAQIVQKARQVIAACEAKGSEAIPTSFDYNEDPTSIVLCSKDLTAISAGARSVNCAFCNSKFQECYKGEVCTICDLSEIGANVLGVQFRPI
eukprot:GEMP01000798.1.p1 GENE.GEMP01000798.1~~GEMP01000798.1.p1  ORF type:complete len:1208 (+),score=227.47 GEMP01000798.1:233-3856(+)